MATKTKLKTKICNPKLGIKDQATQIAKRLAKINLESLAGFDDDAYSFPQTYAFYNGRERSIAVEIPPVYGRGFFKPGLVIVFGECRNSDAIVIDYWTIDSSSMNGPVVADFPDVAYQRRIYLACEDYDNAVGLIVSLIETWLQMSLEAKPFAPKIICDSGKMLAAAS